MTVTPHVKTLNLNAKQQVQSMTVAFANTCVQVHLRLNHKGITSYHVKGLGKWEMGHMKAPYERAALRLVYQITGQSVWLRDRPKGEVEAVALDFVTARV